MRELLVATKNKKKLTEVRQLLKGIKRLKITSLEDYPLSVRIVENGKTFRQNAEKKALKISLFSSKLVLGEDSGLSINALGGRPGIYSSRFSGKNKSDRQNNLKVLKLLKGVPLRKRSAHYTCAVALACCGRLISVKQARCYGRIAFEERGNRGFGYDPLFQVPKYGKTFGQLGEGIKHRMSHRYHALRKMRRVIEKYIEKQCCT